MSDAGDQLTSRHVKDLALMARMVELIEEMRFAVFEEANPDLIKKVDAVLAQAKGKTPRTSGAKILEGLQQAAAGNFARVHIDGQTWVREK